MTHGEHYGGWTRVLKAAGVQHVGTHGIRHRETTDIANSGVPTKVGMKLTGHKTVAMFMHYVHTEDKPVRDAAELVANRLLSVKDDHARQFHETEALRGGWSVRQLDRQIGSQFYERTALSKDKAAMLVKGSVAKSEDAVTPNDAIKYPYVLEFLDLKDEYSESDLEAALIQRLEDFLLG